MQSELASVSWCTRVGAYKSASTCRRRQVGAGKSAPSTSAEHGLQTLQEKPTMSFSDIVAPLFDNIEALFEDCSFPTYTKTESSLVCRIKFGNWLHVSLMLVPIRLVNKELKERVQQIWKCYPYLCIKPALRIARRFGERSYDTFPILNILENIFEYSTNLDKCAALLGQTVSSSGSIAIATGAMLQAMTTFWAESHACHNNLSLWTESLGILNDALLDIGVFCPNLLDLDVALVCEEFDTQHELKREVLTQELQKRVFALAAVTSGCRKIEKLHIDGWLLSHHATRGIEYIIQNCEFLEELSINYCELTENCIQLLHEGLPNLKRVLMAEGPELSAEKWNDFLKARYDLGLERFCPENTLVPKSTEQFAIENLPRLSMFGYYCESDDDYFCD